MTTALQIAKFAITASDWTPLFCPTPGAISKAWFLFDGDLRLRSDPADPNTEYLLQVAQGNTFDIPCTNPVSGGPNWVLIYAQAASGAVNVTVFAILNQ